MNEYVEIENCMHRSFYEIDSRNLSYGIYDEKTKSFVGIRTKFKSRFLDREYHWDTGPPHGTAKPMKKIGILPDDIDLSICYDTVERESNMKVAFDTPVEDGGRGWYFIEGGGRCYGHPVSYENEELFNWIESEIKY